MQNNLSHLERYFLTGLTTYLFNHRLDHPPLQTKIAKSGKEMDDSVNYRGA
jgi:hypothetical protein